MDFLNQVMKQILGNIDPVLFVACLLMAYAGFILSVFYGVMTRNPTTSGTPMHYSGSVFWYENWKRMLFNVMFLPLVIIFSTNFIGATLNTFLALGAGIGSDALAKKFFSPVKQRDNDKEE